MSWATSHIGRLQKGETVVDYSILAVDDVVLCCVRGAQYLHLVKAIRGGPQFLIGNNRGGVNGWISTNAIYGKLVAVAD